MRHFQYLLGAAVFALLLAVIGSNTQVDLTEKQLYTLSPSAERILAELDEPLEMRFTVSEELVRAVPSYAQYQQRISALMEQLANASNGQLTVSTIIAESFSDDEDAALASGLTPIPLSPGVEVYFGIALRRASSTEAEDESEHEDEDESEHEDESEADSLDDHGHSDSFLSADSADTAAISVLNPAREAYLEYDMLRLVSELATTDRPVVGILTSEFMFGTPSFGAGAGSPPWAIVEQLKSDVQIELIFSAEDIERVNPQALILVHQTGFDPRMQYAIEQFAFRGGALMVMVDPKYEDFAPTQFTPDAQPASDLRVLPASWGVSLQEGVVAADTLQALSVGFQRDGRNEVVSHLAWLRTTDTNFPSSSVLTGTASDVIFPSAGSIVLDSQSPFTMEPLITTSASGGTVPTQALEGSSPNLLALPDQFTPQTTPVVMAALLRGQPSTAFPNGAPPPVESAIDDPQAPAGPRELYVDQINTPEQPINLIVIADVDFLRDRFWVQTTNFFGQAEYVVTADNGALFFAVVENIAGFSGLTELQLRGVSSYPFTQLNEIRRAAEQTFQGREAALEERVQELLQQLDSTSDLADEENLAEEIRRELITTRSELRSVNRELNRQVESVESNITLINILLIPLLIGTIYGLIAVRRSVRGRRRRIAQSNG